MMVNGQLREPSPHFVEQKKKKEKKRQKQQFIQCSSYIIT